MNDGEFERVLLQSARADAPPDDAREAWTRFSRTLGAMGPSPPNGDNPTGGHPTVARGPSWPGNSRQAAMKWLLWGAIGGSAATAAVMLRVRKGETRTPAVVVVERATAPMNVAGAPAAPSRALAPGVAPSSMATTPLSALATRPRRSARGGIHAGQEATGQTGSDSTLSAEVSRIDAARTANAAGDYDETVWLVERYHRDFPAGALAPDADVVALEAVAAKHDRPETARRAALFLSRYPDDPHTEKVKWLAEHLSSDPQ